MRLKNVRTPQKFDYRFIRNKLIEKHGCTCGYCKAKFFDEKALALDSYYPRSTYPEKQNDEENYVLACHICNAIKSNKLPISVDGGKKNILHPYKDDYSVHMHLGDSGLLVPDTEEGASTIDILKLNREALCQYRRSNPMTWNTLWSEIENPKDNYQTSIKYVEDILKLAVQNKDANVKEYLFRMLYGNVITAMETYLSSTIIQLLRNNEQLKWQFVEKFDWGPESFSLNKIKKEYEEIDIRIITKLGELLYHNLSAITNIYKKTLNIDVFSKKEDMSTLCKAVVIRHDIVHRNGRTPIDKKKRSSKHIIGELEIRELIKAVNKMTKNIQQQIKENNYIV